MINNTEQLLSLFGKDEAELIHGDERYPLTIETSPHCTQNCPAGINVKGYVTRWKYESNERGEALSEIEPITDEEEQRAIRDLVRASHNVSAVHFL